MSQIYFRNFSFVHDEDKALLIVESLYYLFFGKISVRSDYVVLRQNIFAAVGHFLQARKHIEHADKFTVLGFLRKHGRVHGANCRKRHSVAACVQLLRYNGGACFRGYVEIRIDIVAYLEIEFITHCAVIFFGHFAYVIEIVFGNFVRGDKVVAHIQKRLQQRVYVYLVFQLGNVNRLIYGFIDFGQRAHIKRRTLYRYGIAGKHVVFHIFYVALYTRRNSKHKRNAYNAYTARKRNHQSTLPFGQKIFKRQHESHSRRHGRTLFLALVGLFLRGRVACGSLGCVFLRLNALLRFLRAVVRHTVVRNKSVQKSYNARGILLRKLGIVGYHYDEPVF